MVGKPLDRGNVDGSEAAHGIKRLREQSDPHRTKEDENQPDPRNRSPRRLSRSFRGANTVGGTVPAQLGTGVHATRLPLLAGLGVVVTWGFRSHVHH